MPSISAGIGKSYLNTWDDNTNKRAMASWMVGLTWNDVFLEGNALGYAVGQPQFVYDVEDGFVADGGYAMELWYSFQVTDNIQVTPAIYWLGCPWVMTPRTSTATTSPRRLRWFGSDHLQVLISRPDFGWAFR